MFTITKVAENKVQISYKIQQDQSLKKIYGKEKPQEFTFGKINYKDKTTHKSCFYKDITAQHNKVLLEVIQQAWKANIQQILDT